MTLRSDAKGIHIAGIGKRQHPRHVAHIKQKSSEAHLLRPKRWPLSFFSRPPRSASFFFLEAATFSFLSSPLFCA